MFHRLLIANRGEIAVRIARACRESGIVSVALHSEVDASALHVREADEAIPLQGASPAETYLNASVILEAARSAGCEAIHPGYGFLSEDAAFARAVRAAGLVFIGPEAGTIQRLGDKTRARELARTAGIPVVPGYAGGGSEADFLREAKKLGFPVLVKAAGGGGGRGMRVAATPAGLEEALHSARREAEGAFGNSRVFLEKLIPSARHVEIQVLGDLEGRVISLFERDCSVQRRYQKILEESPSPALTEELRERMGVTAVAVAKAAGYSNAGTVEFLLDLDSGEFYFLEMNTRLQVEHPVTEVLTGVDLVAAQIQLAVGEPISPSWAAAVPRGHALECRLYAEDPARDFAPSPGRILRWKMPEGPGVRVDSGYAEGDEVSIHYDSLLAKIIVSAEDREAALRRMEGVLRDTVVLGPTTNQGLLKRLLAHPVFRRGDATTDFLANHLFPAGNVHHPPDEVLIAAAILAEGGALPSGKTAAGETGDLHSPWRVADGFRLSG